MTVAVAASPAWADGGTGYEPRAEAGLAEAEPCGDVVWGTTSTLA